VKVELSEPAALDIERIDTWLKARVENGRYVIDEPAALPEGAEVQLQVITGDELDDEERAALHASLERAADDSEAGRKMDAREHLKQYRARRAD
jgi:hypothetical protein